MKLIFQYGKIIFTVCVLISALSCNSRSEEIPLAASSVYPQPVTMPVKFSEPLKINWTDSVTNVNPVVKKFDLNKLPSSIYDSTGFLPFAKKPSEIHFDFDKLPDTVFNYDNLPSKPLKFEISILDPPKIIKAGRPFLKKGIPTLLYGFSDLQGIVGSSVTCLFQDKSGFLWIGTDQWLLKYDGENLILYVRIKPGTWINRMFEDNYGAIWAGTGGNNDANGLFKLDLKGNIVKHLNTEHGLSGSFILGILQDDSNRVWVSTAGQGFGTGINIIDENAKTIKYLDNTHGLSNIAARFMMKDKENIWICTRGGGVDIIDLKKGKISYLNKTNGLSSDTLSFVIRDSLNKIWIATRTGDLNEIDLKMGLVRYYGKEQGLGHPYASGFFCDRSGNIWLGTSFYDQKPNGSGVLVVDPVKSTYKAINPAAGLDGSTIQALLQDKLGQVWIATEAGMNIFNRDGRNISHQGNKSITSIAEDDQGLIWIGNFDPPFGIDILNRSTGLTRFLTVANGLYCDTSQNIIVEHNNIWIATNRGIDMIDSARKQIRHFGKAQGLAADYETTMLLDGRGNIWLGAQPASAIGIDILNPQRKTIYHLGPSQSFKDSIITDIKEDNQGKVWIATQTGGVTIVDPLANTIKSLEYESVAKDAYSKIFLPDRHGNLWIGTDMGLFMINPGRDSIKSFSTKEGLINNQVTSLNENGDHIYVGTKGGVTIIYTPSASAQKNWIFESFGNDHGIVKQVATYISDNVTKAGAFLWGDRGLTIMDNFSNDNFIPKTNITGLDIFNQTQYFVDKPWSRLNENDTLKTANKDTFFLNGQTPPNSLFPQQEKMQWDSISDIYNLPVNLRLPYYQNYLQFHFTQSYIGNRDTIWYRYILLGEDNKWSEKTPATSSRNYLDLPPGKYTFKVTGLYKGNWSEPAAFQFTILPPWWQTWWAYVLDVLAVSGLAWIFAKYRSRRLEKENLLLEDKITERTAQLRQSLENLKTTQTQLIQSEKMASLGELTAGIAHEIQNPLNFVNNFSEVNLEMSAELKDKIEKLDIGGAEKAEIQDLMSNMEQNELKINHHGKRADAIVKGMLQHSRSSNGIKEPTDLNALADEYLRLSYHGLRAKDKSSNAKLETHFDPAVGNVNIIPQDIGRVLLNLYNNALYSVAEKKKQETDPFEPTVMVTTKKLNGKIELRIKDNGMGVPQKVLDKIFQPFFTTKPTGEGTGLGLSMSYDIIKAHNGDIKVESKEGEGAAFIVSLPSDERY